MMRSMLALMWTVLLVIVFVSATSGDLSTSDKPDLFLPEFPHQETCYITQAGGDGFGHQTEGKLSCIYVSMISASFHYVHTPFYTFDHMNMDAKVVENFANIGEGFENVQDLVANQNYTVEVHDWSAFFQGFECQAGRIYAVDNCWPIAYKPPIVGHLGDIGHIQKMRKRYLATQKPETGFEKENGGRPNVVIHVRRGDAGDRIQHETFYDNAITYYRNVLPNPLFWFESDEPTWPYLLKKHEEWPLDFRLPNTSETHLVAFHRMVMADGLVCSYSGFSLAPALLSLAAPIVVTAHVFDDGLREGWFETPRFTRISAT